MYKTKRILSLLAFITSGYQLMSQSQFEVKAKKDVSGFILDKTTQNPVEFATVSVFQISDLSLVGGAISNHKGKFNLSLSPGKYELQIQFLTYKSKTLQITITRDDPNRINLGGLVLEQDTKELDEVIVKSERTQMELHLDKKVYNVGKDLSNLGGSAADILDNLPSVAVDVDGNVGLRGSNNVKVLIDGKPSGLVGLSSSDALRQLQGDLIDRVEIITNPSARYDAEGQAGIINIILKKERAKGFNGSFSVNTGYPDNHGGSISINLRKKWFNLFTNFGGNYRNAPGTAFSNQKFNYPDTSYRTNVDRDMARGGLNYSSRFGVDFFINKSTTLTAYYLFRFSDEDNFTKMTYNDYDQLNNFSQLLRDNQQLEDDQNLEFGVNLEKNFKRKGHKLTFDFQSQDNNEIGGSDVVEDFRGIGETDFKTLSYMSSKNSEGEKRVMLQTDYFYPLGAAGSFELGSRFTLREIFNNYLVQDSDDGQLYIDNTNLSNDFNYDENIYAFYGLLNNEFEKLSYQIGTRYEISDVSTELLNTIQKNIQNYANFFPSFFITYNLLNKHKLQASYSRRIQRPSLWSLNPFFSISDSRNFWVGNPNLRPSYANSYELGYLQNFDKSSFYFGVYHRHSTNIEQRITSVVDTLGLSNVTITKPENLGLRNSMGIEMNGSLEISKWWNLNGNANFFYSNTEGTLLVENAAPMVLSAEAYSFSTRLSNNIKVKKFFDIQMNLMYRAPQNTTQGKRLSMMSLDLGLSKDVLDKNGTFYFSVRDLFNTRKYRGITELENYYSVYEYQRRRRQATLSFTYRLNQKKKRGGNRGVVYDRADMDGY